MYARCANSRWVKRLEGVIITQHGLGERTEHPGVAKVERKRGPNPPNPALGFTLNLFGATSPAQAALTPLLSTTYERHCSK